MLARDFEVGVLNMWSTVDFEGAEIILYDTVMVDTWYYAFVKLIDLPVQHKKWTLMWTMDFN